MKRYTASVIILLVISYGVADIAVTTKARKNLYVTVYRDFGIIKDVRKVNLLQGSNRIRFEDVSTRIQESTADFVWNGKSPLEILDQTYEFDLMSPTKLMEKYIGKELEIVPSNCDSRDTVSLKAELISIHGEVPVFRIGTQITFGQIGRILFPYVPDNLYTKPTLIWDVVSRERQDIELTAEYITEGISWNAVYKFDVNTKEETGKFSGWIQFNNRTGLSCSDANITFVAGYAHRISNINGLISKINSKRKSGDFYFYSINHPVTLLDNQKKQLEWIPEVQIKYQQSYCAEFYDTGNFNRGVAYSVASIENNQSNNLGLPLPGGIVRISKCDIQQNDWFVGEDLIEDIKSNSVFNLKINTISDIIATKRKVIEHGDKNNFIIEIKSNKIKECNVVVREFSCSENSLISSDQKFVFNDSYIEWIVRLLPGQISKIAYSLPKMAN